MQIDHAGRSEVRKPQTLNMLDNAITGLDIGSVVYSGDGWEYDGKLPGIDRDKLWG